MKRKLPGLLGPAFCGLVFVVGLCAGLGFATTLISAMVALLAGSLLGLWLRIRKEQ